MFDDKLFIYNGVSYVIAGCNSTLNPTYSVNNTQQDNTPMYNRLDAGPDEIY